MSNKIVVRPQPGSYDVRRSIEDALARRAEREARDLELDISDGRVTVSGVVHSWAERQAVVGAVRGTPGVRDVSDRLHIES